MEDRSQAPVILITGCSSGVGRAVARRFAERGWRVFASMRSPERPEGEALRAEAAERGWRLRTLDLDVSEDASVQRAATQLLASTGGRLDVLVNNAGYLLKGALEEITPDEFRAQMETNVLGAHRVTRAVLPAMRARRTGRILFVSSVAGRTAVPMMGAYCASKFALEAMAETWRYELIPFGIGVCLIEPGPFLTDLHRKEKTAAVSGPDSPYAELAERYDRRSEAMRRPHPKAVVRVIEKAATVRRPRLRRPVGPTSYWAGTVRPAAPDWLYEWIVRRALGLRKNEPR